MTPPTVPPVSDPSSRVDTSAPADAASSPKKKDSDLRVGFHTQHEIATDGIARGFEASTIFPRGVLGPLYTDYTGKFGIDYRFKDALRPYFIFGVGNYHTESPEGRELATGMHYQLEAGFLLNEEPPISFGNAGTGFFGGYHHVGLGLDLYSFNTEGVSTFPQLTIVNRRPFFQGQIPTGAGNLVLGLSLLSSNSSFNLGDDKVPGCPEGLSACSTERVIPRANLVPLSLNISFEPESGFVLRTSAAKLYPGEVYPRIADFTTRQLTDFISVQDVPRYANTRLILEASPLGSVDSQSSSNLARVGMDLSFLSLTFSQGRYAADLGHTIRRGSGLDQGLLIGSQAAMVAALWAVCGTAAKYPSGNDILAGKFGAITDFSGRGACIQAPVATEALGLALLDGYGATGDPHSSPLLFWLTHVGAGIVGAVGVVNYIRPFGNDPDTIAFSGGRGVVKPSERLPQLDNRFRDGALLSLPLFWAIFSGLNRRTPLTLDVMPTGDGAMATASGKF